MSEITLFSRTMSSREIAEVTDKEHRNVTRDIRAMCEELEIDVLRVEHIYLDSMNREQVEYRLDRDLTLTLVSGYSAKLRLAIIQRMRALEVALIEAHVEEVERLATEHAHIATSMRQRETINLSARLHAELQAYKRRFGELDVDD